jgi:hypothetical protein
MVNLRNNDHRPAFWDTFSTAKTPLTRHTVGVQKENSGIIPSIGHCISQTGGSGHFGFNREISTNWSTLETLDRFRILGWDSFLIRHIFRMVENHGDSSIRRTRADSSAEMYPIG